MRQRWDKCCAINKWSSGSLFCVWMIFVKKIRYTNSVPNLLKSFDCFLVCQLSRIQPALLVYRWDYVNTNKVIHCLNQLLIILISREFYRKQKINLNLKCTDWWVHCVVQLKMKAKLCFPGRWSALNTDVMAWYAEVELSWSMARFRILSRLVEN